MGNGQEPMTRPMLYKREQADNYTNQKRNAMG